MAKGSITRIEGRLTTIESESDRPNTRDSARQILAKLKEHDAEFRRIHLSLIDLIEDDEILTEEQATLDEHDDLVASLTVRIMTLADSTASSREVSTREVLVRRCDCLEFRLLETNTALSSLTHEDVCQLQQYQEQLLDFKREIAEISNTSLSLTFEEADALSTKITVLEKKLFDCSLCHKELLHSDTPTLATHSDPKGVKLPKLNVPLFDGNLLHWISFWEQFRISVHDRSTLTNAEKFVYLQQSLKGGMAKSSIDGLSQSGENYPEAVEWVQSPQADSQGPCQDDP